jgi:hypothetical protein
MNSVSKAMLPGDTLPSGETNKFLLVELKWLGLVLLAEGFLWVVPYMLNATEQSWHWVNDQGPSFLVWIGSYYLSRALLVIVPLIYVITLIRRISHNKKLSPPLSGWSACLVFGVGCCLLVAPAWAQAPDANAPLEKKILCDVKDAARWVVAESTMVKDSAPPGKSASVLHWQVPIDHFAGEAKYPIGWPRVHFSFKDDLRDWSGWDFLLLRVFAETSRESLPPEPVGMTLHNPEKQGAYQRTLAELKKNQWTDIWIPLAKIPRMQDVRLLQFHLTESKYRHLDKVDLFFEEIALVRYAKPMLRNFAPEQAVMFADTRYIPVSFELMGTRPDQSVEVDCELKCGGKTVATVNTSARRGAQKVVFALNSPCSAGEYELVAKARGGKQSVTAPLRLVASPWQGGAQ